MDVLSSVVFGLSLSDSTRFSFSSLSTGCLSVDKVDGRDAREYIAGEARELTTGDGREERKFMAVEGREDRG